MDTSSEPTAKPSECRDFPNRFTPGNSLARKGGLAPKRAVAYRKAIEEAQSVENVVAAVAEMRRKFMEEGDVVAGKIFLLYTLGPPPKSIDVSVDQNLPTRTWTMADVLQLMALRREMEKGNGNGTSHVVGSNGDSGGNGGGPGNLTT